MFRHALFSKEVTGIALKKNVSTLLLAEKKKEMEEIIDRLQMVATDPYANSLPLLASALLGDKQRFATAFTKMYKQLNEIAASDDPENAWMNDPQKAWMRGCSFKAWMLGRMAKAANHVGDAYGIQRTPHHLEIALRKGADDLAFHVWAMGYSNIVEDRSSVDTVMDATKELIDQYQTTKEEHPERERVQAALSNALWACVLNLLAAAQQQSVSDYQKIKETIRSLIDYQKIAKENTARLTATLEEKPASEVKLALVKIKEEERQINDGRPIGKGLAASLLRTSASNDYPAWALAEVRLAAAMMGDADLFEETEQVINDSIEGAKGGKHDAEYALAFLENTLAEENWKICQSIHAAVKMQ